jgi:hypothetical protein
MDFANGRRRIQPVAFPARREDVDGIQDEALEAVLEMTSVGQLRRRCDSPDPPKIRLPSGQTRVLRAIASPTRQRDTVLNTLNATTRI